VLNEAAGQAALLVLMLSLYVLFSINIKINNPG